jgi:ABC-type multidrug transport system fused ATPase/permease subunit
MAATVASVDGNSHQIELSFDNIRVTLHRRRECCGTHQLGHHRPVTLAVNYDNHGVGGGGGVAGVGDGKQGQHHGNGNGSNGNDGKNAARPHSNVIDKMDEPNELQLQLLRNVSGSIPAGSLVALIGTSGSMQLSIVTKIRS